MPESASYAKGLEGVVAGESEICRIDGQNGRLYYLGYSIEELARESDFEETTYLLLHGKLPNRQEMAEFSGKMRSSRGLSEPVLAMVRAFPRDAHPMELLQSVVSYLSGYVQHRIHHSPTCNCRDTLHQVGRLASVVAAWQRLREGRDYVPPRQDLSHGANFLYMLRGSEPEDYEGRIMDTALVLHAEHGFNASTFTARAGPPPITNPAPPRAGLMGGFLGDPPRRKNDRRYLEILKELERDFRSRMEEKGKPLYPNVDFYSGAVYALLGIPTVLFTPIFAMARVAGWLAHILEQRRDNKLARPASLYTGAAERRYVRMEDRR